MKTLLLFGLLAISSISYAQSEIYVIVNSGSSSTSCNDSPFDPGEANWSVDVENNGPTYYGYCPPTMPDTIYSFNNGPFCSTNIPSSIEVRFDAFEGDGGSCYQSKSCNVFIIQNIPVPTFGVSANHTISIPNNGSNSSWGQVDITIVHAGTNILGANDFSTCTPMNLGTISPGFSFGDVNQPTFTARCGSVAFQFETGNTVPSYLNISSLSVPNSVGMDIYLYEYDGSASFCVGSTAKSGNGNLHLTCLSPNTTYYVRISGIISEVFGVEFEASNIEHIDVADQTVSSSVTNVCIGDSTTITIGNSEEDVMYIVRDDANNAALSNPIFGTGGPITYNTGAMTSTTTFNVLGEGLGGSGIQLNASNSERVEIANPPTNYGSDLTVEAWVYFESPSGSIPWMGQSLFNIDNMGSNVWIWHSAGAGSNDITWFVNDGGAWRSVTSTGLTGLTGWHHIATTAGTSGLSIYVDGELDASTSTGISGGIQVSPASSIHIGNDPRYPSNSVYYGDFRVSEFRVWDTERTSTEISNNAYSCLTGSETGLLIYNRFLENAGTSVASDVGPNAVLSTSMNPITAWVKGVDFCSNNCEVEMSQTVSVIVDSPPTTPNTFSSPPTTCTDSVEFQFSSPSNVPGDHVYYNSSMIEIDRVPYTGINLISWTVNGLTPGNHTFYVTRTSGACESAPLALNVTVLPSPNTPSVITPVYVCSGDDVILQGTGSGTGDLVFYDDLNTEIGRVIMGGNPNGSFNNGAMSAGSYTFTIAEDDGTCTSNPATVVVEVNLPSSSTDVQIACGPYTWIDGNTYTSSNNTATHTVVGGAASGCDSIVQLDLTIQELDFSSINIQDPYCNGTVDGSIEVNATGAIGSLSYSIDAGINTQGSNIFYGLDNTSYDIQVVDGTSGCQIDSTVSLVDPAPIMVTSTVSNIDCHGDQLGDITVSATGGNAPYYYIEYTFWGGMSGNTLTDLAPGTYVFHATDNDGCVGIDTVEIIEPPQITGTDIQTACGSFTWIDGNTYVSSNNTATFNVVGGSANGCDSLVTLNLTILSPTTGTDVQTACGSYTWIDGNTYTTSNNSATYNIVGGAANGCDSLVTLDLTILSPTTGTDAQTACGSYTWIDGNTYTTSNNSATYNIAGGAANGCDSLISLDLTILSPSSGTDVQTACSSYTWIDGNTYTSSNNTATFTISGGALNGCDSTVTLDLTITSANTNVTQNGTTLTADASSATYQWLDCDNAIMPITGETNQVFIASTNGNYAVEVTENGCSDTSACFSVTGIGIDDTQGLLANVYPNPSTGAFTLELNQVSKSLSMSIYSSTGQLIFRRKLENELVINFNLEQAAGLYLLVLEDKTGIKSNIRLIKE